jgi:hypothetical protein
MTLCRPNPAIFSAMSRAFLVGERTVDAVTERLFGTMGRHWRWIKPLARRMLAAFPAESRPRRIAVISFLQGDEGLRYAILKYGDQLRVATWIADPPGMLPVAAAADWQIPALCTVGELADWLAVSPDELHQLAGLTQSFTSLPNRPPESRANHYHYRVLHKMHSGIRLIEAPKQRLKELQSRILIGILEKIPVNPSVHGFLRGHSIQSFAAPHCGKPVVLRMDLRDFFPSITAARVRSLFLIAGYPEPVSALLGGICTHATPRRLWSGLNLKNPSLLHELRGFYARPHLPQGAPTSPALANLCAWRADCRLSGLARSSEAVYTRYADDLAFSGGEIFARCVDRFHIQAAAILSEEGFLVCHRKTRIMRTGVRQYLAGLVVNDRLNVVRKDFDTLKAILTNCVRHGAERQNREKHPAFRSHLEGRVSFVESVNPAKGKRLRRVFEKIEWQIPK